LRSDTLLQIVAPQLYPLLTVGDERMTDLLPSSFPVATAAFMCGLSERPFRRRILNRNLVERDDRGFVTKASIEQFLKRPLTPVMFLAAERRRDSARAYQRDYRARARQMEAAHAVL
jgi:hypothetical protein